MERELTALLREILAAEGVEQPEAYWVELAWEEIPEADRRVREDAARLVSELMGIPLDLVLPAQEGGGADGR